MDYVKFYIDTTNSKQKYSLGLISKFIEKNVEFLKDEQKERFRSYYDLFFTAIARAAQIEKEVGKEKLKEDINLCAFCFKDEYNTKLLLCSTCNRVYYCSKECQRSDWKEHKQTH